MIGKILTKENTELLKLIYSYGGYVRISHLDHIFAGISHVSKFKKLDKLQTMKYLTCRRLKSDSKREPVTYQVTKSTCRMFLNPDAYIRKKHQEEYIYRSLIKSYFCFQNHNEIGPWIVTDHDARVKLFEDGEFKKDCFPMKHNKDSSFIHFEELVLDFTQKEGKELSYNDRILYDDNISRAVILFVDHYYRDINKQIYFIVNRYLNMINNGGKFQIDFLIIVDDPIRENLYNEAIAKFLERYMQRDRISDLLAKFYFDYLVKYHDNDTKTEELKGQFLDGTFKRNIIDNIEKNAIRNLTDQQISIQENVALKGVNYIIERTKSIVNDYGGFKNCYEIMSQFYRNLFYLEYYNHIKLDSELRKMFDIKVYKIAEKIYQ